MTTKGMYLIGMLALLFLANIAMLMGLTNWPQRTREGFAAAVVAGKKASGVKPALKPAGGMLKGAGSKEGFANLGSGVAAEPMDNIAPYAGLGWASKMPQAGGFVKHPRSGSNAVEGFMDTLTNGFATAPIGSYDGVNMAAALQNVPGAQGFRARLPNEPLAGPPVEIGPDNLFYFKNNQCKPECCGATLSCDGGCVCTTPEQRDFINQRGGNRKHEDGF